MKNSSTGHVFAGNHRGCALRWFQISDRAWNYIILAVWVSVGVAAAAHGAH